MAAPCKPCKAEQTVEFVDLFPKTIAVGQLQSLAPDIIAKAIDLIDIGSGNEVEGDGAYTTDQQFLNRAIFRDVKQEILAMCREFAKAYSHIVDDIAICNSWGNVVGYGESIRYHKHSNAYISGSFYLTEGSPFNIMDRNRTELFGFAPAVEPGDNYRALESFTINPKPGRIILFPSGLMHCVLPSKNHTRRYSVAFNTVPVGRIGGPTGLLELRPVE
jgi:uncharacterized protein (TIGR02466 family)